MRRRGGAKERKKEKERETRAKLGRDSTRVLTRASEETTRVSKTERRSLDATRSCKLAPGHCMRCDYAARANPPRRANPTTVVGAREGHAILLFLFLLSLSLVLPPTTPSTDLLLSSFKAPCHAARWSPLGSATPVVPYTPLSITFSVFPIANARCVRVRASTSICVFV